jgi:hypothetical protein
LYERVALIWSQKVFNLLHYHQIKDTLYIHIMQATIFDNRIEIVGFEEHFDAWDDIFCFDERLELPTTKPDNNIGSAIFMLKRSDGTIEYEEDHWYDTFYGLCWNFDVSWTLRQRKKYAWFILKAVQELLEGEPIILTIKSTSKVYKVSWSETDPFKDILSRWDLNFSG